MFFVIIITKKILFEFFFQFKTQKFYYFKAP